MKRSVLILVLLVSVGMNAGILSTLLLDRWRAPDSAAEAPGEAPSTGQPSVEDSLTEGSSSEGSASEESFTEDSAADSPRRPAGQVSDARASEVGGGTLSEGTPSEPSRPQELSPDRAVGPLVDRLIQRLGLQGEVAEQFRELQYELYQRMRDNRRRAMQVQFRLRRELAGDRPDGDVLRGLVEDSGRLHAERQALLVRVILQSREVLDRPQQREYQKFLNLLGRHLERRRNAPPREEMRRRMLQRRNSSPP